MASAKKKQIAPKDDAQLKLLYSEDSQFKYWTSHLFNEVYLRRDLPEKHADRWGNIENPSFQYFMNTIRDLALEYKNREKELSNWSETETINNWVKHVFDGLGWNNNCSGMQNPFLEETSFRYGNKTYRTDILIVDHPKEKQYINSAKGDGKLIEARNLVVMPVEVKYWQRLEEFRQGRKEENSRRDVQADDLEKTSTPNEQIVQYMDILNKGWGVLTDGSKWRLFNSELSSEDPNRYFEFNLYSLIESINTEKTEADRQEILEAAKYFYHFFSKETFSPKEEGDESFVGEVLRYSKKYVNKVEEDLKDRFVKAMNIACNGFNKAMKANGETRDLGSIRNIAESALFNILFIKSLESRGVLPMSATDYKKLSLSSIIDKIERFDPEKDELLNTREMDRAFRRGNGNSFNYSPKGTELHDRIVRLTKIIHDGNSKKDSFGFEIAGFQESVFTSQEWNMFKNCKIQNSLWIEIIFQLGYAKSESKNRKYQQIPYSYFTPRQLGSIYESFLEFKIDTAETDLIYLKRQWVLLTSANRKKVSDDNTIAKKGDLFFTPDTKDRKASGSYYTPDYVVQYIVRKTVDPLVLEKSSSEILKLKICDPAMGSGHFLSGALNYLSKKYIEAAQAEGSDVLISSVKETVLKNCIYGVDLNPRAVKLAKLSAWLETSRASSRLENLEDQFVVADSLISSNIWPEHPKLSKGGLDAIVGNPPYVRVHKQDGDAKDSYREKYPYLEGDFDIYICFFSLAQTLLKDGGRLGYIFPNKFFSREYAEPVRKELLEKFSINEIVDIGKSKDVFDAAAYTAIAVLEKGAPSINNTINIGIAGDSAKEFLANQDFDTMKQTDLGMSWILKKPITGLANIAKFSFDHFSKYELFCGTPRAKDYYAWAAFLDESKKSSKGVVKYYVCKSIKPFVLDWDAKISSLKKKVANATFKIDSAEMSAALKGRFKTKNKILIRGNDYRLTASLDTEGSVFVGVYGLILEDSEYLFRTLAWMNSSLCNYTFSQENSSLCLSGGYFSINAPHIEAVKIPDLRKLNEAKMKSLIQSKTGSDEKIAAVDAVIAETFGVTDSQMNAIYAELGEKYSDIREAYTRGKRKKAA